MEEESKEERRVLAKFKSDTGEETGGLFDLPIGVSVDQLTLICNNLLQQEENTPFNFYVEDREVINNLEDAIQISVLNTEQVIEIVYQQQAVFKVRAVTRCTSSLPGHAEAVVSVRFSPDGKILASGSGDTTVRFWDISSQTPHHTCKGHRNWVLCIAWSPDSTRLVSGCKNGLIFQWNAETGKQIGNPMAGHKQWITSLVWEPFHSNPECRFFASSSKDGDIRVWDALLCRVVRSLCGHTQSVTSIQWGGAGLLYSSSQDRTIKVWKPHDGILCRTLQGHAHWVNTLALNTDYILRTGGTLRFNDSHDPKDKLGIAKLAKERYDSVCAGIGERLASGSDDFTLFLWNPESEKKPLARMTGHQQLINNVQFSPDARTLASASFDKSVKLWDGKSGVFLATLRGHVQAVYMIAWSADSRLLVSGSADSTLKVWSMKTRKLLHDLPGHIDEVFAVDWSPLGDKVASGGKDKVLKLWQN